MKTIKIGLLARILIAIALGIGFGNLLPAAMVRVFVTFNGIFSEFLGFIIPLIILGLVTPAIADIGKEAGKMLVITTLVAYGATLFSGFLSYFTGATFFPSMITPGASIEQISEAHDVIPFFYNPQIQISAESGTKRSIFRQKNKTKRSKKGCTQHL